MAGSTGAGLVGYHTKTELVYEHLRSAIMEGRLRPGERIVADAVARELQISKIPIREALSKLQAEGLIVQTPHAGARVTPLSLHELRGVYLTRQEIEGLSARVAAQHIEVDDLAKLAELHQSMIADLESGNLKALTDLNRRFHVLIARATTYTTLVEVTESMLHRVHHFRVAITRSTTDWESAMDEHAQILQALQARDQYRAEGAARHHAAHQLEVELGAELEREMFVDAGE